MRKSFGNTYWGKQWLNALTQIDYSNRLPRGKTYARKGAAYDIEIDGNVITAKVSGSRPRPYKVKIKVPEFTRQQSEKIIRMVTDNPVYLSQLLNRQLPPALNETFAKAGVHIFPTSWSDLNGNCSCPDWAVPCKHLAAVLYLVANEIDKNPFLVFELHAFDLLGSLEANGFFAEGQQETVIPSVANLQQAVGQQTESFQWSDEVFKALDFSKIPNCSEQLLTIYGEQPVFYPEGDFKKHIAAAYKKIARATEKNLPTSEVDFAPTKVQEIELILNQNLRVEAVNLRNANEEEIDAFFSTKDFTAWLETVPLRNVLRYSSAVAGMVLTYQLAKRLAQNWAYLPQLLEVKEGQFAVRWLAANVNEKIRTIGEQVAQLVPTDLVFLINEKGIREVTHEQHFETLLSVFLTHFVNEYHGLPERYLLNSVVAMFFAGTTERFIDFEHQEYPQAIQLWLNKFYLREKDYAPVIQVEEVEDENVWTTFAVTAAVDDKNEPLQPPVGIDEMFAQDRYNHLRLNAIRDLTMLAEHFPKLNDYLAQKGREPLLFNNKTFVNILFKILPVIRLFGIKILLPKTLRRVIRPSVSLALQADENAGENNLPSLVNLDNMLSFDWMVAMGEGSMSPEEFMKLAQEFEGIVKLNDQFVFFDENELKLLIEKMKTPPQLTSNELLKVALTEEYEGAKIKLDEKAQALLKKLLNTDEVPVPAGLLATLRPYQLRGFAWLYKNAQLGFGSIIADDMGLGKTLQVITTLLKLKEEGAFKNSKALVIVPTTLLTNWGKEIAKFAPSLNTHIYHGSNRKLEPLAEADALITTYGVIRSEQKTLAKMKWLLVAIDEAQAIKNPTASQTKAVKKIKAPVKIAMSGTPVENRLTEYWSIFDFTNKGYLGTLGRFKKDYAKTIEVDRDQEKLDEFKKVTAPFILRRLKSDRTIIKDLPEKIEKNHFCTLTPEQTALYENVVKTTMETIEKADGIERKGLVLKLITALKQVCNHPYQFLKKGLVEPQRSGKSVLLFELLEDILAKGEKTLIFTQYQTMGSYLQHMLEEDLGVTAEFLHGGVTRKGRDKMVENFQNNRDARVLILSLKAGGTGLNLTAANHVIHYDLWWNPAVEAQATDRAYRIGQQKNVLVHRFIAQGTFEEKINELLQIKKELANLTVATGETWIGDYGDSELRELVALE